MQNLLPCPFCGSEAKITERHDNPPFVMVGCSVCETVYKSGMPVESAVEKWNTRAGVMPEMSNDVAQKHYYADLDNLLVMEFLSNFSGDWPEVYFDTELEAARYLQNSIVKKINPLTSALGHLIEKYGKP